MTTPPASPRVHSTNAATESKDASPLDPLTIKNPGCSFGGNIEALAGHFGIQPADFSLAVAGILTNIAGPYAGLIAPAGNRIRPHLNILNVADSTPRVKELEERLFHPLRLRVNWIRQRASSQSHTLLDCWVFGDHDPAKAHELLGERHLWMKQHRHDLDITQEEIFKGASMPDVQFDEYRLASGQLMGSEDSELERRSPGPGYLPSVVYERIKISKLASALQESLHRQPFLIHPALPISQPTTDRTENQESLTAELVEYLRGRDCEFPAVHKDQGPGSYEHAQVQIWADANLERIGDILTRTSSSEMELLQLCLLWEPARWKTPSTWLHYAPSAWKSYTDTMNRLLNLRCFGRNKYQKRVLLSSEETSFYHTRQEEFLDLLDKTAAVDQPFVSQFHDLPARLLWMFSLFRQKNEKQWCIKAAFRTAEHAVRMQENVLQKARSRQAEIQLRQSVALVTAILTRKGPCKLRDMQRSTNNRPAMCFEPGLQLLKQQGRLAVDDTNRFVLLPAAS